MKIKVTFWEGYSLYFSLGGWIRTLIACYKLKKENKVTPDTWKQFIKLSRFSWK